MLKRLLPQEIGKVDLIPQALIKRSVSDFKRDAALQFDRESDDLDGYDVAYLEIATGVAALIHHDGDAGGSVTLYLPRSIAVAEVDRAVAQVLQNFNLPASSVIWRESRGRQRGAA